MPASDPGTGRYTRTAIVLHWLVAALVIAQFAWGWWMQTIPKEPVGPRVDAFNLHKSVGLVILALMLVRLGWRLGHPPPALPPMARWQRRLAHLTHGLLYAALLTMPVAGYLGSAFSGYPVKVFGVVLPSWSDAHPVAKDLMSDLHFAASWVLLGAFLLHLAGVAKHVLVDRDELLARMGLGHRHAPVPSRGAAGATTRGARSGP